MKLRDLCGTLIYIIVVVAALAAVFVIMENTPTEHMPIIAP